VRHEQGKFRGAGGVELHYHHWSPGGAGAPHVADRVPAERMAVGGGVPGADGAPAADGEPAAGTVRATVVISHGVAEHGGRYRHVAERLTACGYSVWAHDHRGHGRSGGRRGYVERFGSFVADLETFRLLAAADEPGPQFLVGHSMGGAVALAHVLDHPQAWSGLVLSNPAVAPRRGAPLPLVLIGRLAALVAPRSKVVQLDAEGVSRDPAVVRAYRDDPLVYHGKLTARLVAELVNRTDRFPREVAGLTLPVLMAVGGDDQLVDPAGPRELFAKIGSSGKALIDYPGLHHELFNEPERDQVLADVADWLDAHLDQGRVARHG
jgi:alpha-beta hydrolase superfamily lysophospholipase